MRLDTGDSAVCPQPCRSPLWALIFHPSDSGMDLMLSHDPISPSFSESVTITEARRYISWASTFPLLSPVGKVAGLCFLQADRSYHSSSFLGFCGKVWSPVKHPMVCLPSGNVQVRNRDPGSISVYLLSISGLSAFFHDKMERWSLPCEPGGTVQAFATGL